MKPSSGRQILKPKIRENEEFEMTLEYGGYSYTFRGMLNSFNLEAETDYMDLWESNIRHLVRRSFQVDMGIQVIGQVTRRVQ